MADRAEQLQQIADHVAELAQPIHSAEPYERYDRRAKRRKQFTHTVVLPSLLDQVRHAARRQVTPLADPRNADGHPLHGPEIVPPPHH